MRSVIIEIGDPASEDGLRRLAARSQTPVGAMAPTWWRAWATHLMTSERWKQPLRILAAIDERGAMCAALPYASQQFRGLPLRSLAGPYFPYRTFLLDDAQGSADALADAMTSRFRSFRLGPCIAADNGLVQLLRRLQRRGWTLLHRRLGTNFVLDLGPDGRSEWPSPPMLKQALYKERKFRKTGEVQFDELSAAGRDEVAAFIARMATVESKSWVATDPKGDLKIAGAHRQAFWHQIASDAASAQHCKLSLLRSGDSDIAFMIDLAADRSAIILANGYDESVTRSSPGMVAVHYDVAARRRDGATMVDWGLGDGGYKQRWGFRPAFGTFDIVALRLPVPKLVWRKLQHRIGFSVLDDVDGLTATPAVPDMRERDKPNADE